ncbi:MAG TPA: hypothetical protein ENN38_01540 [Actinobacteria bacterium]|nr:hypothetical protein [Actinomycetota bacterium]
MFADRVRKENEEVEKGFFRIKNKSFHYQVYNSAPLLDDDFIAWPPGKIAFIEMPGGGLIFYQAWEDDFDTDKIKNIIE